MLRWKVIKIIVSFVIVLSALHVRIYGDEGLSYRTHVQDIGWMPTVAENEIAGTTGKSLRMEAIEIFLPESLQSQGNLYVQVHVQDIGWMTPVKQGQLAGTTGRSLRVEAVKIWLDGSLADSYDIVYRAHVQDVGWQSWVRNQEVAGTTGRCLRMEAMQIYLEKKDTEVVEEPIINTPTPAPIETPEITTPTPEPIETPIVITPTLSTSSHVQDIGWMSSVGNNQISGTTGKSLRLEALKVTLDPSLLSLGNIDVQTHVEHVGWMSAVHSGQIAGTTGKSYRLEGLKISLTGTLADSYDIYYRTHVEDIGWLGWCKNGELAGSTGCSRRIEAVQIAIYPKNASDTPTLSTSYTTQKKVTILVVNKQHGLSPSYAPGEDPTAGAAIRRLINDMRNAGYSVSTYYSGYRSYSYQSTLYNNYVARDGRTNADRYSARPGYSEHQTGLAFDLMSPNGSLLTTTREVTWVARNAHKYGFIVRYPEGKESITGYMAEPWHLRYVGSEATAIYQSGLTLEEYTGIAGGTVYK